MDTGKTKNIILRGPPGSGKTTFAKTTFPEYTLVEADQYFEYGNHYFFDPYKLAEAHKRCLWAWKQCIDRGLPVIVANTFPRIAFMTPYFEAARGVFTVFRLTGNYPSIHPVKPEKIESIRAAMEPYHGEQLV